MEERSLLAQIPDQRLPLTPWSGVSAPIVLSDSHGAVCFRFTKYRADTASDAGRSLVFTLLPLHVALWHLKWMQVLKLQGKKRL